MILVDLCRPRGVPWAGGFSCHLISDESETELLDFAVAIRIPMSWYQARAWVPHFELAPRWRARALAAGARDAGLHEMAEGMRLWRSRNAK